jgi:hypothetical protein
MKRRRKKSKGDGPAAAETDRLGPTAIARLARISVGLASRKLRAGKSPAQIIEEAERHREQQMFRMLPSVPVNGTI